jgi:hypothetical protein
VCREYPYTLKTEGMKKQIFLALFVLSIACSKDSDSDNTNNPGGGNTGGGCGSYSGYQLYKDSGGCYYNYNGTKYYVEASNCDC